MTAALIAEARPVALSGDWKILQIPGGHCFSTDDIVTVEQARRHVPRPPRRVLDLGCGIGSAALMCAWLWRDAEVVGIEAQAPSATLARASVGLNDARDRVRILDGDLRDARCFEGLGRFDLVTCTPPYLPLGTGTVSGILQKAYCRFEIRGGVGEYFERARAMVAPEGGVSMVHGAREVGRVADAAQAHDLQIRAWRLVVPVVDREPLMSLYWLEPGYEDGPPEADPPLIVRQKDGLRSPEMRAARDALGMPDLDLVRAGTPRT